MSTIWGWPHGAAVKHTPSFTTGFNLGGSATLIGRRTAIGAAHSFHNGSSWLPMREWAADIIQYKHLITNEPTTETVYGTVYGCHTPTIPYGYVSAGGNTVVDDFVVIEFTCGNSPGDYTGWIPCGIGNAGDIWVSGTYIDGYDHAPSLPSPIVGSRNYSTGSMLTRYAGSYSAMVDSTASSIENHWLDTTSGSSGSGLLKNLFGPVGDGTYYWSGVRSHASGDPSGGDPNRGRLNDLGLWWFIRDYTSEW